MRIGGRFAITCVPRGRFIPLSFALSLIANPAWAQANAPNLNSGDTAWMLISSALVLLMTPGLALFYGGGGGRQHVLVPLEHRVFAPRFVTRQWGFFCFSLALRQTHGGLG